jgi:hypothetical protein
MVYGHIIALQFEYARLQVEQQLSSIAKSKSPGAKIKLVGKISYLQNLKLTIFNKILDSINMSGNTKKVFCDISYPILILQIKLTTAIASKQRTTTIYRFKTYAASC